MWNLPTCCFRQWGSNRKWPAGSRLQWTEKMLVLVGFLQQLVMIFKVMLARGLATILLFVFFCLLLQQIICENYGYDSGDTLLSTCRVKWEKPKCWVQYINLIHALSRFSISESNIFLFTLILSSCTCTIGFMNCTWYAENRTYRKREEK